MLCASCMYPNITSWGKYNQREWSSHTGCRMSSTVFPPYLTGIVQTRVNMYSSTWGIICRMVTKRNIFPAFLMQLPVRNTFYIATHTHSYLSTWNKNVILSTCNALWYFLFHSIPCNVSMMLVATHYIDFTACQWMWNYSFEKQQQEQYKFRD